MNDWQRNDPTDTNDEVKVDGAEVLLGIGGGAVVLL